MQNGLGQFVCKGNLLKYLQSLHRSLYRDRFLGHGLRTCFFRRNLAGVIENESCYWYSLRNIEVADGTIFT
jgi:hypothetical protein